MEKIFLYNVDIDKTAYMNWRTRPHQPIHDMMIIADGYIKAAIMLAQDCLQDNMDKKADIVVFPILFSANHAIELYLKSINWSLNMLLNEKESFCGGHDIRQIWHTVKKRMISFESDKDHNANAKMKNMDFSRYPFNTDDEYHFYIENYGNEVVDLEMFVEVFKKIGDNLNCIETREKTLPNITAIMNMLQETDEKQKIQKNILLQAINEFELEYPDYFENMKKWKTILLDKEEIITKKEIKRVLNMRTNAAFGSVYTLPVFAIYRWLSRGREPLKKIPL